MKRKRKKSDPYNSDQKIPKKRDTKTPVSVSHFQQQDLEPKEEEEVSEESFQGMGDGNVTVTQASSSDSNAETYCVNSIMCCRKCDNSSDGYEYYVFWQGWPPIEEDSGGLSWERVGEYDEGFHLTDEFFRDRDRVPVIEPGGGYPSYIKDFQNIHFHHEIFFNKVVNYEGYSVIPPTMDIDGSQYYSVGFPSGNYIYLCDSLESVMKFTSSLGELVEITYEQGTFWKRFDLSEEIKIRRKDAHSFCPIAVDIWICTQLEIELSSFDVITVETVVVGSDGEKSDEGIFEEVKYSALKKLQEVGKSELVFVLDVNPDDIVRRNDVDFIKYGFKLKVDMPFDDFRDRYFVMKDLPVSWSIKPRKEFDGRLKHVVYKIETLCNVNVFFVLKKQSNGKQYDPDWRSEMVPCLKKALRLCGYQYTVNTETISSKRVIQIESQDICKPFYYITKVMSADLMMDVWWFGWNCGFQDREFQVPKYFMPMKFTSLGIKKIIFDCAHSIGTKGRITVNVTEDSTGGAYFQPFFIPNTHGTHDMNFKYDENDLRFSDLKESGVKLIGVKNYMTAFYIIKDVISKCKNPYKILGESFMIGKLSKLAKDPGEGLELLKVFNNMIESLKTFKYNQESVLTFARYERTLEYTVKIGDTLEHIEKIFRSTSEWVENDVRTNYKQVYFDVDWFVDYFTEILSWFVSEFRVDRKVKHRLFKCWLRCILFILAICGSFGRHLWITKLTKILEHLNSSKDIWKVDLDTFVERSYYNENLRRTFKNRVFYFEHMFRAGKKELGKRLVERQMEMEKRRFYFHFCEISELLNCTNVSMEDLKRFDVESMRCLEELTKKSLVLADVEGARLPLDGLHLFFLLSKIIHYDDYQNTYELRSKGKEKVCEIVFGVYLDVLEALGKGQELFASPKFKRPNLAYLCSYYLQKTKNELEEYLKMYDGDGNLRIDPDFREDMKIHLRIEHANDFEKIFCVNLDKFDNQYNLEESEIINSVDETESENESDNNDSHIQCFESQDGTSQMGTMEEQEKLPQNPPFFTTEMGMEEEEEEEPETQDEQQQEEEEEEQSQSKKYLDIPMSFGESDSDDD